ncbi:MAG: imidazole glycerol phosphate synthase subunit HisH [Anaerolineae bacterium]|nr:imidazole glycerol phosphate synthase subunit HisH [Anaerolineae bacterium]
MTRVVVIDYGAGNLRSVVNTLRAVGADPVVAGAGAELAGAGKIVLPGVGAFGAGMAEIRARGFVAPLQDAVARGVPMLGICLGLQYLFDFGEEHGRHEGLGLLPGAVVRFPDGGPKVPHIGWNQVHHDGASPLLAGAPPGAYAYFVHSYYAAPARREDVIATTDYGIDFVSVAGRGNLFGVQFHPEKSQQVGQQILRNFLAL